MQAQQHAATAKRANSFMVMFFTGSGPVCGPLLYMVIVSGCPGGVGYQAAFLKKSAGKCFSICFSIGSEYS